MENAKLVYTTDTKDPNYQNNRETFEEAKTETEKQMENEIREKQINLPKRSNDKCKISRKNPIETLRREQELKAFAKIIFEQKITLHDLSNIFEDKNKDQINDTLQTLKYASKHRIKSIGGLWQFIPGKDDQNITTDQFIDQVLENKGARWRYRNKRRKERACKNKENKDTAISPTVSEIENNYDTNHTKENKKIEEDKKQIININTGTETTITIKTNNSEIEIKIK